MLLPPSVLHDGMDQESNGSINLKIGYTTCKLKTSLHLNTNTFFTTFNYKIFF